MTLPVMMPREPCAPATITSHPKSSDEDGGERHDGCQSSHGTPLLHSRPVVSHVVLTANLRLPPKNVEVATVAWTVRSRGDARDKMAHVGDRRASQEKLSRVGDQEPATIIARIVCGGQSGADRAAVAFAIRYGVSYGGWVPRGGWAEDFSDPPGVLARYHGFVAADSDDPNARTALNVRDSNATLIVSRGKANSSGVMATQRAALRLARPLLQVDTLDGRATEQLRAFLTGLEIACTLNVAGPRESECPGVYRRTFTRYSPRLSIFSAAHHLVASLNRKQTRTAMQ